MEKIVLIYQSLPGGKVKVFSPKRQEPAIVPQEEFEAERNDPLMSRYVDWIEHRPNDISHAFFQPNGKLLVEFFQGKKQ